MLGMPSLIRAYTVHASEWSKIADVIVYHIVDWLDWYLRSVILVVMICVFLDGIFPRLNIICFDLILSNIIM